MTVHGQEVAESLTQRKVARRVRVKVSDDDRLEQIVVLEDVAEHQLADCRACGGLHVDPVSGLEALGKDLEHGFAMLEAGVFEDDAVAVRRQDIAKDMQRIDLERVVAFVETVQEQCQVFLRQSLPHVSQS